MTSLLYSCSSSREVHNISFSPLSSIIATNLQRTQASPLWYCCCRCLSLLGKVKITAVLCLPDLLNASTSFHQLSFIRRQTCTPSCCSVYISAMEGYPRSPRNTSPF